MIFNNRLDASLALFFMGHRLRDHRGLGGRAVPHRVGAEAPRTNEAPFVESRLNGYRLGWFTKPRLNAPVPKMNAIRDQIESIRESVNVSDDTTLRSDSVGSNPTLSASSHPFPQISSGCRTFSPPA